MHRLDLSLPLPGANLALDEALLLQADRIGEVIRFWRFDNPVVVIGRGSKIRDEANIDFCSENNIPILRRCSGGAAIVGGPGCLMYSVVLDLNARHALRNIDLAHHFVMQRLIAAVGQQRPEVQHQGTCDLTIHSKKFSGNSLRLTRDHLIYHGTLLEEVDLCLVANCLGTPPRQPEYREHRTHQDFITNIELDFDQFCDTLAAEFGATDFLSDWPEEETRELFETKYSTTGWNWRH